jgi:ribosomal protein L7/L12
MDVELEPHDKNMIVKLWAERNKIYSVKYVRDIKGVRMGLKDAKDWVEAQWKVLDNL